MPAQTILAESSGYILGVDQYDLIDIEKEKNVRFEIVAVPGDFVVPGDELAKVMGSVIDRACVKSAQDAFSIGLERSLSQDPRFGFSMLVEMAVRSVSPSMNDPYTAIQCIDRIREGLSVVIKNIPKEHMWSLPSFTDYLDECWDQLSYYGRDNPPVLSYLQSSLMPLRKLAQNPSDLSAIERWSAALSAQNGLRDK